MDGTNLNIVILGLFVSATALTLFVVKVHSMFGFEYAYLATCVIATCVGSVLVGKALKK